MRIIGEIEGHPCKITAFEMEDKISIKYEVDLLEQTYKFRKSTILSTIQDVKKLVDERCINEVMVRFIEMKDSFEKSIRRMGYNEQPSEFDEII